MDVPGIVQGELDGEAVAASVSLGSEDALFVTPTRTLVYRSESLLSDESVESYPHDAERVTVKDGRRKTRITLTYSIDGERDFSVPSSAADDVLHPVLAGVLNGAGVTDPGETVVQTFRFSELTLIVTSDRLLKHVGSAVWDADHEQYHFEDVTGLDFEEGSVATQIVIEVDGRPQRIKTPNEHVAVVRERLTQALLAYYDVDSLAALNALVDPHEDAPESSGSTVDFGEGIDPLGSNSGSRPADTSGDPFLDDEKTESLDADPTDGHAGTGSRGGDAAGDEDPRRPVSGRGGADGGSEADAGRRRAEPVDDDDSRHGQPDDGDGTESRRRAEPASESSDAADTADADAGGADTHSGTDATAGAQASAATPGDADTTANIDADTTASGDADTTTSGDADGAVTADDSSRLLSTDDEADADAAGDGAEDAASDDDDGEFAAAGFQPATESGVSAEDLADRIDDLEARVGAQNELLEQQQALVQQLIEELRER